MSVAWFQALLSGVHQVDIDAIYLNGYHIDPLNRFVLLYFNKPVYTSGGGAVIASDLALTFNQNGGTATAASISSVKKQDNTNLAGGEDIIRVNISITGTANGLEKITIKPSSNSSIEDINGGLAPIINNEATDFISPTYDTDYQAVLSYAITQGYTVPIKEYRSIENALMVECKAIGLFALVDVMMPLTAWGDVNYALIDWKRLTTATVGGTLAYTRGTGFNPTAAGYIDTLWTPSTQGVNYTLNNASAIFNSLTDLQDNNKVAFGVNHSDGNTGKRLRILPRNTSNAAGVSLNSANIGTLSAGMPTSLGLYHETRDGSAAANHDFYFEGVLNDGTNVASNAIPDQSLVLFAERAANGTITATTRTTLNANLFFFGGSTGSIAADIKTMRDNYNTAVAAVTTEEEIWTYLLGDAIQTDDSNTITTD